MIIHKPLLLLLCIVTLCGSGCGERNIESRTSDKAILFGLGIEKQEDSYIAHAQNINYYGKKGKKGYDYEIVKVTAPNLYELTSKLAILNQKVTMWRHLQALIVHATISYDELKKFIDFLDRNTEIPIDFAVVYTEETIPDVMKISNNSLVIPTMSIYHALFDEQPNLAAVPIRFFELVKSIRGQWYDVYLPILYIENETIHIDGTVIYKKDGSRDQLTPQETKSLMRIKNTDSKIMQTFNTSPDSEEEFKFVTNLDKSKVNMKATLEQNQPVIHITIKQSLFLEMLAPRANLTEQNIQEINTIYKNHTQQDVEATITKVQKLSANILGFAQLLEREHPAFWKTHSQDWEDLYPKLTVRITVDSKFKSTGMSRYLN